MKSITGVRDIRCFSCTTNSDVRYYEGHIHTGSVQDIVDSWEENSICGRPSTVSLQLRVIQASEPYADASRLETRKWMLPILDRFFCLNCRI